ncbi:PorT family protein [Flammeovirga sp. MY04]|uniref:outer membrane beta-barrel protein n=1 Tax=Flammeovirga sp. MY04 TaxID=1191459 RepID=UPI00080613C8|nr:outer membrane beta-barrel protein [Flammeovirga sp. MY04]ANQ51865.1 PorT family protein [Flammeovirga sp. MY04]
MKIKNFTITLLLFIFSTTICNGQAAILVLIFGDKVASENFHLSLDVGANTSFYQNAPGDVQIGWNFGLGTHTKISDKFQLVAEFKMISDRSRRNTPKILPVPNFADSLISEINTSWSVRYFDVPILVRYSVSDSWHFGTGPQFSFLNQATEITELDLKNGNEATINQDIKNSFRSVNYNWAFEVVKSFGKVREGKGLDLRLRYVMGLSNSFSDNVSLSSNINVLQFIVTIPFIEVPAPKSN